MCQTSPGARQQQNVLLRKGVFSSNLIWIWEWFTNIRVTWRHLCRRNFESVAVVKLEFDKQLHAYTVKKTSSYTRIKYSSLPNHPPLHVRTSPHLAYGEHHYYEILLTGVSIGLTRFLFVFLYTISPLLYHSKLKMFTFTLKQERFILQWSYY